MTSGHIYIASGDTDLTTFTVSLVSPSPDQLAILKATLLKRGFPSVMFRGASVVFVVEKANAKPTVAQAIDAIGTALGGLLYRFTLSGYQHDVGTKSERLAFTVDSSSGASMLPKDPDPGRDGREDLYGDSECG